MKQRFSFTLVFVTFLILSIIIFSFSKLGLFKPVEPFLQSITAPIQSVVYGSFSFLTNIGSNTKVKELENKNNLLTKQLLSQEKLISDNKALKDQFQTQAPKSTNLIPADIIGAPGFLPGISVPESFTLDKGEADGVKVGDAIIYKNNLLGKVVKTSEFVSSVEVVTNASSLFTAKTLETNALGVVKGQGGGGLILDNVILSESLKIGDMVITKGDVNLSGVGIVPDLVLGEIVAINKNPSDLFQRAKLKPLVDFSKIDKVFVINLR